MTDLLLFVIGRRAASLSNLSDSIILQDQQTRAYSAKQTPETYPISLDSHQWVEFIYN